MSNDDLGPMPEPVVEEPQLVPGGVDSVDNPDYGETPVTPAIPNPDPADNPATEDVPAEVGEPEEIDREPSSDGASEPESEAPA